MPYYTKEEQEKRRKQQEAEDRLKARIITAGVLAILAIILLSTGIYTISAGHRGVVMTFGKVSPDSIDEGIHLKIPLVQTVKKFEVKTMKIEVDADASSKDLQVVQTKIALNYHLQPDSVPIMYQEIGSNYQSRIIDPSIQEAVKAVQAKYTAEELITKRPQVRDDIQLFLKDKLGKFYIVVDDFNIIDFQFSDEFNKAIEEKVTAEQLKLKAERDLERIKIEKEQKIAQAEAEAISLNLQKQEITPDLIELRKVEVQAMAIEKWSGNLPLIVGGNAMPFIGDMSSFQKEMEDPIDSTM